MCIWHLVEQGKYYEALVTDIDPQGRTITASFPEEAGLDRLSFTVPYDILILGGHSTLLAPLRWVCSELSCTRCGHSDNAVVWG